MSILTPELIRSCKRCSAGLLPGALLCDQCQALVHFEELDRLAANARALEAAGQLREAREQWLLGLRLLPRESKQAGWIKARARSLEEVAGKIQPPAAPPSENKWAQRLGPLGPLAILLAKGKFLLTALFKLKFLLSFAAFFGFYWAMFGKRFGVGFALLILIHEMGHFIDVKRRGLPAEMPVFLPGFGAYVRWQALGVSLETRAAISLAGPLAGFMASAACAALWWQTGDELWAALARAGAWLNLFNLIPVWALDGGQAVHALSKTERLVLLTASLGLGVASRESVFFLVAAGAAYQAFFAGGLPAHPSRRTTIYFVLVMTGLGMVLRLIPGHGFGAN